MSTLVIVESPGKVAKIREYLGERYVVAASVGHIRDLPRRREDIPERYRAEPWAMTGIEPGTFNPLYVVMDGKTQVVRNLQKLARGASEVLFAMDADREGEAIAWHVSRVLNIPHPKRIVFTSITKAEIQAAVRAPRPLDLALVAAQETRRTIDRLIGFQVSPLLWDSVGKNPETGRNASAGRVQSATLLLVAQRDVDRMMFVPAAYFQVQCDTDTTPGFVATLTHIRPRGHTEFRVLARGADYASTGQLKPGRDVHQLSRDEASALQTFLTRRAATVSALETTEGRSRPAPPFVTSTLQQAAKKIKVSGKKIMEIAQKLYEGGYITYMRTDSPNLSDEALSAARAEVARLFGPDALPPAPRQYATKNKTAQEAHEAIRPTGAVFRSPDAVPLTGDELAAYTLIYNRTVASQMHDTLYHDTAVTLLAGPCMLSAKGRQLKFAGHTRLSGQDTQEQEPALPALTQGQQLTLTARPPEEKRTSPPERYSDESIVKAMESSGIGRPSTYAATIEGLHSRGYVTHVGKDKIGVTAYGLLNVSYLLKQVPDVIQVKFTAEMEAALDQIAEGQLSRRAYLERFYTAGLEPVIAQARKTTAQANVPHLSGVRLVASPQGPRLAVGDASYAVPASLVPADLTAADVDLIRQGRFTPVRTARPQGGTRAGSGSGGEDAAPTRQRRGRTGSSSKRAASTPRSTAAKPSGTKRAKKR